MMAQDRSSAGRHGGGQLRIFCDGNPANTKIAAVDADGRETELIVEGIAFEIHGDRPGWLRLDAPIVGGAVELAIPLDGSVVTQLRSAFPIDVNYGPVMAAARTAVRRVLYRTVEMDDDLARDVVWAVVEAMRAVPALRPAEADTCKCPERGQGIHYNECAVAAAAYHQRRGRP